MMKLNLKDKKIILVIGSLLKLKEIDLIKVKGIRLSKKGWKQYKEIEKEGIKVTYKEVSEIIDGLNN